LYKQEADIMASVLERKRIFIVEDDVSNMAVYSVALSSHGASVIQDPWNSSTIELIKRTMPVDVILLDLMLRRGVSGYDIFDEIKADPELAKIPVVAVSASDPEIEIPRAKSKGFAGFIGKPISLLNFPVQVAACIKGEELWLTY
jgi:two-component system cell cycle response regulator DivK